MIYRRYVKRVTDILMATIGLLILGIPMLIIAGIIRYKGVALAVGRRL